MSGPKTSRWELERQRRAQLALLRGRLSDGADACLARLEAAFAEACEAAASFEGETRLACDIEELYESAMQLLYRLAATSLPLDPRQASRLVDATLQEMEALSEQTLEPLGALGTQARETAKRARAFDEDDSFAEALRAASVREARAEAARACGGQTSFEGQIPFEAETYFTRPALQTANGENVSAAQARMQGEQDRVLARRLEIAEGQLAAIDPAAAARFTGPCVTAEDTLRRLDELTCALAQADERHYVRQAVDAVMARHGYDIARSVELGPASLGAHELLGSSERPDMAVHAFFSNEGDVLVEIVGTQGQARPQEQALAQPQERDARESLSGAAPSREPSLETMLAAQDDFCAVYAEIKDELLELGVRLRPRYEAPPGAAHCKVVVEGAGSSVALKPLAAETGGVEVTELRGTDAGTTGSAEADVATSAAAHGASSRATASRRKPAAVHAQTLPGPKPARR